MVQTPCEGLGRSTFKLRKAKKLQGTSHQRIISLTELRKSGTIDLESNTNDKAKKEQCHWSKKGATQYTSSKTTGYTSSESIRVHSVFSS